MTHPAQLHKPAATAGNGTDDQQKAALLAALEAEAEEEHEGD